MIAELGLHRPFDLADLHAEERIRKRRDEGRALRPAEVAAVVRGPRVLGVLLGELAEVFPRLRLGEHLLRLCERCGVVLARDENVARVALLGHLETPLGLLVGRAQVRVAHRHLRLERSQRELRILEVRGLRGHVLRLVSLVVGLDRGSVDAGGGLEALHRQHEVAHLALLPLELGEPRALCGCEKFRGADAALELCAPRLGAQVPLVVGERDAGLGEHAFGGLRGKLAADLERRLLLHRLAQRLGTHPVAETLRALSDQRLADHAFEHLVLEALAELRRNLHSSESLLPLSLLADPAVVRLFERDLGAVRLGGIIGPTEVQVHDAVGAPGGEHERQRPEHQVREPLLTL